MSSSLLSEIKKKKSFSSYLRKKSVIFPLLTMLIGGGWYFFSGEENTAESKEIIFEEYSAKKQDVAITIESDGKMVNADNVELTFGIGGTLKEIFVTEGDVVKAGEKVAALDTDSLEFELQKANIDVEIAQANLKAKTASATDSEKILSQNSILLAEIELEETKAQSKNSIRSAELTLENAQQSLEAAERDTEFDTSISEIDEISAELNMEIAQSNLEIALKNQKWNKKDLENKRDQAYEIAITRGASAMNDVRNALEEADAILEVDNEGLNIDFEYSFGNPQNKIDSINGYKRLQYEYKELLKKYAEDISGENILEKIEEILVLVEKSVDLTEMLIEGLDSTMKSAESSMNSVKSQMITQKSKLISTKESLISARQSVQTAELNLQKQIVSDENSVISAKNKLKEAKKNQEKTSTNTTSDTSKTEDQLANAQRQYESAKNALEIAKLNTESNIKNAEIKLQNARENFSDLLAPPREIDVATLKKQIENANIQKQKAKLNLEEATLTSPIVGEIVQINVEEGETVKADSEEPVIIISGEDSFEAQVYIEEADISRIELGQKVYVTFDALENVKLEGEVEFISSTDTTDNSGIVTYLVKVPITGGKDAGVRQGMTAYAEFVIKEAKNVIAIPVSAVKNQNGKPSVQLANGEWKAVATGFTDGKMVEIISGLNVGEKVMYKK